MVASVNKMDYLVCDYEVPRVLVTCRKNWTDYNDESDPIPFRRRVFSSSLDGQRIRGKHLVLLGLEDRRPVLNWILRLANDRDGWDNYPWGSHIWPTLYKQLKDANVKCWPALYATQPTDELDKKSYSLTGFLWAFKTWILESFRAATNDYYTRYRRFPRIVVDVKRIKVLILRMLSPFLHGQLPVERLVPDEIEAGSRWWVLSRAYFDGHNIEDERIPCHINRNNYFEVPSEMYREFKEQRRGYRQMMEKSDDIYQALPPTTVLPKKRNNKTKEKGKAAKLSPLNLGNTLGDENVSGEDVTITEQIEFFFYENVDPDKVTREAYTPMAEFILNPYEIFVDCYMKGYRLPSFFWPQLVPHLCTYRSDRSWPEGWLSGDHMNSWIQFLIRQRSKNDNWTLSKSVDGSMRPYPAWKDVNWVYMPINVGGVHWVTRAINLVDSIFYVFDSMESRGVEC
ncbi:phospholipase-like protein [Tanacetum coccineum]